MNRLPIIDFGQVKGKSVLVRAGLEVGGDWKSVRWKVVCNLVDTLLANKPRRLSVIGHKGGGLLAARYGNQVEVNDEIRNDLREEQNSEEFALELARGWGVYVNEAFDTAHRKHTSIDALPRLMKKWGCMVTIGPRFVLELAQLDKVWDFQGKKLLIVGGAKAKDKSQLATIAQNKFDVVLRAGKLEGAQLRKDGLDISDTEVDRFKSEIASAAVIVLAGPMGKYEEVNSEKGTREVFEAVAKSEAYKIIGGGDTEAAARKFGMLDKVDWVSVGGGAMLTYLATGTLVGLEAILD